MMKELDNDRDAKQERKTIPVFLIGEIIPDFVTEGIEVVSENTTPIVNFLIDKFNLATDTALEVASKLPQSIKEQIEKIDDVNLDDVTSSVVDTIKSIELPDIDFPDLDL